MATSEQIKNEKIRFKATFYNNIAVALSITFFFVPFLAVSGNDMKVIHDCVEWFKGRGQPDGSRLIENISYFVITVTGMLFCIYLVRVFRNTAEETLEGIE